MIFGIERRKKRNTERENEKSLKIQFFFASSRLRRVAKSACSAGHVGRRGSERRLVGLGRWTAVHHGGRNGGSRDDATSESPVSVAQSREKAIFVGRCQGIPKRWEIPRVRHI